MSDSIKKQDPRLRFGLCLAGLSVAGIGLIVITGWLTARPALVQFVPNGIPMAFNTAFTIILVGAAFFALANERLNILKLLGVGIFLIGLSTLSQYLTGLDLGIDELLWKQQMLGQISGPGRMSPNAAFTFGVTGCAFFLMASKRSWSRAVVLLASIIIAVSFIGLCGYAMGLGVALRWGRFTGTALPTDLAFLVIGVGILGWSRARPTTISGSAFSVPFFATASVITVFVGAVSLVSTQLQEESARWVRHSELVMATLHGVELKLTRLESDLRGLALTRQPVYVTSYQENETSVLNELARLQALVSDNGLQTTRAVAFKESVKQMLIFTRSALASARDGDVSWTAEQLGKGADRVLMDEIRAQASQFEATERQLLTERERASLRGAIQTRGVILLGSGLATAFFAVALIITQRAAMARLKVQTELGESQKRLDLALESAEMGVWDLDLRTNLTVRSLRHDQIFGYKTLQPRWSVDIFMTHVLGEDREEVNQCFENANATDRFATQCRITWSDQSVHWISAQGRVFRDQRGQAARMLGVISDITGLKTLQSELVKRNQALEIESSRAQEANRMKSEFLANMSHELRTPLNAIIGFSELLRDGNAGPLNEDQLDFLADVLSSAEHLLDLINDLLDLAKIEAGRMELVLEEFDLESAIQDVVGVLQPLARKKGISITATASSDPFYVTLDLKRVKQILLNLLSNAIKFTGERGSIQVCVTPATPEQFELSVTDNGIGIKEEDFPRLFVQFEQLAKGAARPSQGTGLGLALTKKMVQLHGGSIGVTSQPGKGARFNVVLPLVASAAKIETI